MIQAADRLPNGTTADTQVTSNCRLAYALTRPQGTLMNPVDDDGIDIVLERAIVLEGPIFSLIQDVFLKDVAMCQDHQHSPFGWIANC